MDWATPSPFYNKLDAEFSFTLDPCASHENHKCGKYFTEDDDGLAQDWGCERVFMNPPYGKEIVHWMAKAYHSATAGALVVCLVPARTDTQWWWGFVEHRAEVRRIKGRIKFVGSGKTFSAPFPSALVIYHPPLVLKPRKIKIVKQEPQLALV